MQLAIDDADELFRGRQFLTNQGMVAFQVRPHQLFDYLIDQCFPVTEVVVNRGG